MVVCPLRCAELHKHRPNIVLTGARELDELNLLPLALLAALPLLAGSDLRHPGVLRDFPFDLGLNGRLDCCALLQPERARKVDRTESKTILRAASAYLAAPSGGRRTGDGEHDGQRSEHADHEKLLHLFPFLTNCPCRGSRGDCDPALSSQP